MSHIRKAGILLQPNDYPSVTAVASCLPFLGLLHYSILGNRKYRDEVGNLPVSRYTG